MSVQALAWVLENSRATHGARLVLIAIANHANKDGEDAWPSVRTLAREARLSERQVQYAIRKLEKLGELTIFEGRGPKGCNRYAITPITKSGFWPDRSPPGSAPRGCKICGGKGCNICTRGVQSGASGGAKSDKKHVADCTRTVLEPSKNPGDDRRPVDKSQADAAPATRDPGARARSLFAGGMDIKQISKRMGITVPKVRGLLAGKDDSTKGAH